MVPDVAVRFSDRVEAGRRLAALLTPYATDDVVVLGLPRGGVPVAAEVAEALGAPLDVIVVRKLGVPGQPELAMGALGEDGVRVLNRDVLRSAGVGADALAAVERTQRAELDRRTAGLRRRWPRLDVAGRTVIIVDDGIATGATARAACEVAREHGATRVVLAAPVGPRGTPARFAGVADELVLATAPRGFAAVGEVYDDFNATGDDEVAACLERAARRRPVPPPVPPPVDPAAPATTAAATAERHGDVLVPAGPVTLDGHLHIPAGAVGLVLFAHGSGSSGDSPRNRVVAERLHQDRLGTLLFDLETPAEQRRGFDDFALETFAGRLRMATEWLRDEIGGHLPLGYCGASTGAAVALWTAAGAGPPVAAVVGRGGRPDLAAGRLSRVTAPTLLVVGGHDRAVLDLNRSAATHLGGPCELAVVPGAGHLFSQPGTLEQAADLAAAWFTRWFARWLDGGRPPGSGVR